MEAFHSVGTPPKGISQDNLEAYIFRISVGVENIRIKQPSLSNTNSEWNELLHYVLYNPIESHNPYNILFKSTPPPQIWETHICSV